MACVRLYCPPLRTFGTGEGESRSIWYLWLRQRLSSTGWEKALRPTLTTGSVQLLRAFQSRSMSRAAAWPNVEPLFPGIYIPIEFRDCSSKHERVNPLSSSTTKTWPRRLVFGCPL